MTLPLLTRVAALQLTTAATYTSTPIDGLTGAAVLDVSAEFAPGAGGGTGKAYLQSSLDQGQSWFDLWCFTFATTAKSQARSMLSGSFGAATLQFVALADDTAMTPLILGDRLRWQVVTIGTAYSGMTEFRSWAHIR
jgi:hypothetical protein